MSVNDTHPTIPLRKPAPSLLERPPECDRVVPPTAGTTQEKITAVIGELVLCWRAQRTLWRDAYRLNRSGDAFGRACWEALTGGWAAQLRTILLEHHGHPADRDGRTDLEALFQVWWNGATEQLAAALNRPEPPAAQQRALTDIVETAPRTFTPHHTAAA